MALAGFSIGEAEGLRRAMSRKRSREAMEAFRERFVEGAARNGVDEETANRVYEKLAAFSGFGFPKSHAAAFALLAYQSAWLRRHYAAEFLCALLNAQPMGFYPPASLVRDAQRRGVDRAAAGRQRERRVVLRSRTARCASASATCREWGRRTPRRSRPGGRTRTPRPRPAGGG